MNIFYTNFLVPEGSAGCTRGPFIFIRPEYKGDAGLLAHEKLHVRQGIIGLFVIHAWLYLLSDRYKLWCEVECYKEQAKYCKWDTLPLFALYISRDYGLDISVEDALVLLRK